MGVSRKEAQEGGDICIHTRASGLIPGWEDPLATHSSILAWKISWREEPGELQSMGSQGVRYDRSDLAQTHAHRATLPPRLIKSDSSYLTQQKDSANLWHSPVLKLWSVNRLC